MRSSKATGVPFNASSDIAPATSARCASRSARCSARPPTAPIACVPFRSARPSLTSSCSGSMPARFNAPRSANVHLCKTLRLRRWRQSARWANGARSPLAPTDPFSGMTGVTPAFEHADERIDHEWARATKSEASTFARNNNIARASGSKADYQARRNDCEPDSIATCEVGLAQSKRPRVCRSRY